MQCTISFVAFLKNYNLFIHITK
uniref:Uncharacterized protein n=1 Tax=Anguilla anguilla TaxID=7936 RepID=A0A0E9PI07_ANGAN